MDDDEFNPLLGCFGVLVLIFLGWPIFWALWQLFSGG